MLPFLSCAMLPIQRKFVSGRSVDCWAMLGVPLGLRISYQRTPACCDLREVPTFTECVTRSDSYVPKLRYAKRYMRRSARESSFCDVPSCGMHAPPLHAEVNVATGMPAGPVSFVFALFAQSTWNFHRLSVLAPLLRM